MLGYSPSNPFPGQQNTAVDVRGVVTSLAYGAVMTAIAVGLAAGGWVVITEMVALNAALPTITGLVATGEYGLAGLTVTSTAPALTATGAGFVAAVNGPVSIGGIEGEIGEALVAGAAGPPIARITPGSLPAAEEESLLRTLDHIDAGTIPTGSLAKKWGTPFRNRDGDLPGVRAASFHHTSSTAWRHLLGRRGPERCESFRPLRRARCSTHGRTTATRARPCSFESGDRYGNQSWTPTNRSS